MSAHRPPWVRFALWLGLYVCIPLVILSTISAVASPPPMEDPLSLDEFKCWEFGYVTLDPNEGPHHKMFLCRENTPYELGPSPSLPGGTRGVFRLDE